MDQDEKKIKVAEAALEYIENNEILGIGSGSTVNCFIEMLDKVKSKIEAVVSSSEKTSQLVKSKNIKVIELREAGKISVYIDGADESNKFKQLIKGGGGALTREKIVANSSSKFICMIDDSKYVGVLGKFPLPIEVIKMAQSSVAMEMIKLGGRPILRENFITDNGNIILDVHDLEINEPIKLEKFLNNIPGVVTNGLFAIRCADKLLIADDKNIEVI
ncbi:MAG: ribose-5-phosphate isomerase RpiA [Gammaproteobacteria bacterium]|jgi:ribose 5-phosphate isomerase A|nr:ribose-5-phosphate isomerase RpiA [Gammaproteobacteria bacterium]MBT4462221.1 ribose-5-phosphate isomerase RpiA [Gammaproteobacteria bacterium]MBT4654467.1 ribose-5-phosphate isomerase RpiA [Gammaproteobacteria bacterium]MBT5117380.1 ribose-5-phosphate isomerase RpiA [Gammaproteobacteria bacterium]MBT5761965.1 ribose-5-phosphate isomerase RpiA [Gammaproteobacteria bacterium]